jgi:hypothetical protein
MSNQDGFDVRLAAHFEQEHRHVSADAFVAATMQKVRRERRRKEIVRIGMRAGALLAVIAASPWLTAGVERLNAALEASSSWAMGFPGMWVLGALALVTVVAMRVRGR